MNLRVKIVVGVAALLLVVVGIYVAGSFIIPNSIRSNYQSKNCEQVFTLDSLYTSIYPPAFMADKSTSDLTKECALYTVAVEAEQKKERQDAYNAYNVYRQAYPKGLFINEANEHSALILTDWAIAQLAEKKYADAIGNLQLVLKDYGKSAAATEAVGLFSDVYLTWAKDQRERSDFAGAESTLKTFAAWAVDLDKTEETKQALRELAQTYLVWGQAFQTQKKFDDARAKIELAISTDPEPLSGTGPASQAKAAKAALYTEWGDTLLAKNDFAGALDRYQMVVSAVEEKDQPAAKDHVAEVYLKWADHLSSTEDFLGALKKVDEAAKSSGTENQKKVVESAKGTLYTTFSKSTGSQAVQAIKDAVREVCENKKNPALPIFGLDKEHKLSAIYGVDAKLPENVLAKTPASLHYVACIEMDTKTLQQMDFLWAHFAREQYAWHVTLRTVNDPEKVSNTVIEGGIPPALPQITYANFRDFLLGGTFYRSRGTNPDPVVLANWLLTVMK